MFRIPIQLLIDRNRIFKIAWQKLGCSARLLVNKSVVTDFLMKKCERVFTPLNNVPDAILTEVSMLTAVQD